MAHSKQKPAKKKLPPKVKKKVSKTLLKPTGKKVQIAKPSRKKIRINPIYLPLVKKLQTRRDEITGQVNHLEMDLKEEIADNQNIPGDVADHGSGELSQHLSVTLMENDRIELERIERAISRIEEKSYGECEICGKIIPMMRLKAIPWATRCIRCQSRMEG